MRSALNHLHNDNSRHQHNNSAARNFAGTASEQHASAQKAPPPHSFRSNAGPFAATASATNAHDGTYDDDDKRADNDSDVGSIGGDRW